MLMHCSLVKWPLTTGALAIKRVDSRGDIARVFRVLARSLESIDHDSRERNVEVEAKEDTRHLVTRVSTQRSVGVDR